MPAHPDRTPLEAYKKISKGHSILLETLGKEGKSFITGNPFLTLTGTEKGTQLSGKENKTLRKDALSVLESRMEKYPGSWAFGFLSYDYARTLEKLPELARKDIDLPLAQFILAKDPLIFEGASQTPREPEETAKAVKITSNLTKKQFEGMVKKAREHIKAGEIYQVDLAQRFSAKTNRDSLKIYENLRQINPSPFSAYLNFGNIQIISSSPERLIRVHKNVVETRPIAGTKKRIGMEKEDRKWAQNLKRSPKERAEHIMMVDLARNDIGKVCEPGTVCVDELMAVEKYSHVQHIASNVKGTLRKDKTGFDALRAIFPGGTITGAPKIRAMEIIEELEPVRRNIYTGSIGYFAPDGSMDFNIAIRTILVKGGKAYFQTGAGIVYDSNPRREYEETIYKAQAMMEALGGKQGVKEQDKCSFI